MFPTYPTVIPRATSWPLRTTIYGHLSKTVVRKGQDVARGMTVGYVGNTGLSTGPHLHYEVWIGTQVVDPMHFLEIRSPLVEWSANNR